MVWLVRLLIDNVFRIKFYNLGFGVDLSCVYVSVLVLFYVVRGR